MWWRSALCSGPSALVRPLKIINQNVGAEKKHPKWKYDKAPFYVVAPEQDDQRQSVAKERDPTRRACASVMGKC